MHTRAAVAILGAEASNKIVTGKATSDRSMSHPFPTAAYWCAGFCVGNAGSIVTNAQSCHPAVILPDPKHDAR
jgi:hypothetical protein